MDEAGKRPLDDILAKFDRADENIRNLNAEINAYLRANPAPYEVIREFQNEGRDYVVKVRSPAAPLRFAVLTGEVVHHLRAILDYLVWVLVIQGGDTPNHTHEFPICIEVEKFVNAVKRGQIKGVSAAAAKLIEEAQPYHEAVPEDYVLTVLNKLDIRDKHRLLLTVVAAAVMPGQITITGASRPIELSGISPPLRHQITEDGTEVVRLTLGAADPAFKADIHPIVQIALEKAGVVPLIPITDLLTGLAKAIREIVARFAPELGYTVERLDGVVLRPVEIQD